MQKAKSDIAKTPSVNRVQPASGDNGQLKLVALADALESVAFPDQICRDKLETKVLQLRLDIRRQLRRLSKKVETPLVSEVKQ